MALTFYGSPDGVGMMGVRGTRPVNWHEGARIAMGVSAGKRGLAGGMGRDMVPPMDEPAIPEAADARRAGRRPGDQLRGPHASGLAPAAPVPALADYVLPLVRGVAEMVLARLRHRAITPARIHDLNREAAGGRAHDRAMAGDLVLVDMVARVLPKLGRWLPFRSDCLVQAMAAQHWLASSGIASSIVIGVDRLDGQGFSAHAWLRYGDCIVTGGNVDRFTILFETGRS